jgi:Na+(H+)/acetate symporter ActP
MFATLDPYILAFSAVTVIVTIWMGFRSARTSKTASDFFVAGRSVSVGWNASAISGEYLSAASFMGIAGMVMSSGYDALWYPVCYACGYLFLLLFIAGPLRRFGAYTIPDFAEGRFDSPLFRKIAVCFVLFIGFFYTMPQMKGAGTTLAYIFPGLPYWAGVVLVGAVITLNVALGGMKGITLVQAFQYWAKMFAISVPIFVLMAVYGHYGKQLNLTRDELDGGKEIQHVNWRIAFVYEQIAGESPTNLTEAKDLLSARWNLREIPGLMRAVPATGDALARSYASLKVGWKDTVTYVAKETATNEFTLPAFPKMSSAKLSEFFRALLETNGVHVVRVDQRTFKFFPSAKSSLYSTIRVPEELAIMGRKPLPEKAPADATWLSPFGPLTTKAATTAGITGDAARPYSLLYTYSLIIALVCGTAGCRISSCASTPIPMASPPSGRPCG